MSRRGGQSGTVVKKGNWWHGRYYIDVAGSTTRARKSVAIGRCDEMTKPEARRKLAVMLHELGVNDNSYLEKALTPVKLFSEQAEWWEANVLPMHKPSSQNSSHYILWNQVLLQDVVAGVLRRRLVHGKNIRLPPLSLLGEKLHWRECLLEIGIIVHSQLVQHHRQLSSRLRLRHLITMADRYRLAGTCRAARNVNIISAVPPIALLYDGTALTTASAHGSPFSMTRLR